MYRYLLFAILWIFTITPLAAEENNKNFTIHKDRFVAGTTAVHDIAGVDDLFMAGETVRNQKLIAGSVHLAGRTVISTEAVGGDAYVAGMEVSIEGDVTGDVTVAGYNISVGQVGGDLRASGSELVLSGPVAGYAMLAGEEVEFYSVIKGDVMLAAQEVEFSDNARIDGKLTLYEEEGKSIEVPTRVVPEDRIERRHISEWQDVAEEMELWNWRSVMLNFLKGVLIITVIASLIAAIAPEKIADLRREILSRPFTSCLYGFLAQSALIGSIILFMLTLVGLLLVPVVVLVAVVAAFAGYVVAAYAFGVGLLKTLARTEPNSMKMRALAAGIGAFTAGLVALVPFFGWLFVLALTLSGLGAITIWLFRPKFFVSA